MERPRDTLPSDILSTLSRVVRAYVKAFALRASMPTAKEFKDIVIRSRDKDERKKMEDEWVESVGGVDKVSRMWA
ncbi:hypothetical protein BCR44DRAFT_1437836 [Catenaria anguillulae PL171]|uniref:Uncharacterized protein n=1 Tax=Catenaria anguillulae PL171 TaxID=765915 RepID=A0A1Y2HKK0_9FUNG|nr:hypothetical protein BCR44DRAFT_1437836 [Catenaria anguillulae PL171]